MRRFVTAALLVGLVPASALAQQQPATAPTAPAAASAPAAAPSTPAATPTAAPAESGARPAPPTPWANSQMTVQVSANGSFFDRSYNLSGEANSALDMSIYLQPRYRLNRLFQLRARWIFNVEFTNADSTTTQREPRFTDPVLDLWFDGIPRVGALSFKLAAGLAFPVSPESRAATAILTPRAVGQIAFTPELFGGDFALIGQLIYSHQFSQFTTAGIEGSRPYQLPCVGSAANCSEQLRGSTNWHDSLTYALIISQTWGAWSPGIYLAMTHRWAYAPSNGPVASSANPGATDTNLRQFSSFSAWLDYNPNSWLTVEAGYWMYRDSVLDGDGRYGNPFYTPYQDWRVYLSANIVIDKFIESVLGEGTRGAGTVRTHNTPQPRQQNPFLRF